MRAASAGDRCGSFSISRSTASTTTIASSTTMPMASTRASSDTVLAEIAERQHHGEGADQRYRHGDQRNERGPDVAEEQVDDDDDEYERLEQRVHHLLDAFA